MIGLLAGDMTISTGPIATSSRGDATRGFSCESFSELLKIAEQSIVKQN